MSHLVTVAGTSADPDDDYIVLSIECVECGTIVTFATSKSHYIAWLEGGHAHDVFTDLPDDLREMFVTGVCYFCRAQEEEFRRSNSEAILSK